MSKKIRLARGIVGGVFGIGGAVLVAYVCAEWYRLGSGWWSLVAEIGIYGSSLFGIWFTIDQALQGK